MNTLKTFFTNKYKSVLLLSVVLMVVIFTVSLVLGSSKIDLIKAVQDLLNGNMTSGDARILFYVRLPRAIACLLVGAALSVCGVIIQGVMNNALAGPNIIGVNSGAGLFCVLATLLFPSSMAVITSAAFIGAVVSTLLIYTVGVKTGASRMSLVLAGVAIGGILNAIIDGITVLNPDVSVATGSFFVGGFQGVSSASLFPAIYFILAGLVLSLFSGNALNLLSLGEETAISLGVKIKKVRFLLIVLAGLLAGASVSIAGLLGFVGLMVPHATRALIGTDNKKVIPLSAIIGACFVMFSDTLSRVIFAPFEVPVGIFISILGGVFFLNLLLKQRRRSV